MDYLFVYGTLMKSQGDLLGKYLPEATCLEAACIQGRLFNIGDYPGLILINPLNTVYGEIFSFPKKTSLKMLDEYEDFYEDNLPDSEFIRVKSMVKGLETRKNYDSWVYIYNRSIGSFSEFKNGNYTR